MKTYNACGLYAALLLRARYETEDEEKYFIYTLASEYSHLTLWPEMAGQFTYL